MFLSFSAESFAFQFVVKNVKIKINRTIILFVILYECNLYNETVHQLFIDFKKAYDSVRREACTIFSLSLVSPRNW